MGHQVTDVTTINFELELLSRDVQSASSFRRHARFIVQQGTFSI